MTTVYNYRLYCNYESKFVELWDTDTPTVCPNNNTHEINEASITVIGTASEEAVVIKEEISAAGTTGGHYQATSIGLDITANTTAQADFTYPIPIGPLSIEFMTKDIHEGDEISVTVAPNTIIGALTADVSSNVSGISVSNTVVENTFVGAFLDLFDGVNNNSLNRIKEIYKNNNHIIMESPTVSSFSATSPTYVRQSIKMMHNVEIGPAGRYMLGESKIGASYIPAETTIRLTYSNKSTDTDKRFTGIIENLY